MFNKTEVLCNDICNQSCCEEVERERERRGNITTFVVDAPINAHSIGSMGEYVILKIIRFSHSPKRLKCM